MTTATFNPQLAPAFTVNGEPPRDMQACVKDCLKYSDEPGQLLALLPQLRINATLVGPASHAFIGDDKPRRMLHWRITVSKGQLAPFTFDFWGSQRDAQHFDRRSGTGIQRARQEVLEVILYNILCCIRSDYHCEPIHADWCAEFGYGEDSRAGFDLWQACLKQAAGLNKALRLSDDELNALPI